MRKTGKTLIFCCLAIIIACAMAACKPDSGTIIGGDGNVIHGGERPDYDKMFDYNSGYVPQKPVDLNKTLTLSADAGVTFAGGSKTAQILAGSSMPAVINNNQGTDIAGWYNVDNISSFWKQVPVLRDKHPIVSTQNGTPVPDFIMPQENLTIAPFLVEAGRQPLITASSHFDNVSTGVTYLRAGTRLFQTDIGMQIGAEINYSGPASTAESNGRFRFLTSCAAVDQIGEPGLITAGTHTFYFWFTNLGEETLKFQAYQVSTGTTIISAAKTDEITLTPGQSAKASITLDLTQNRNAMTIIYLRQAQTGAKLGIVMSKNA